MNKEKSTLIAKGIRESFRNGTSKLANRVCYGYTQNESGHLLIHAPEAEIVRWIFDRYIGGDSLGKIVDGLAAQGMLSPSGNPRWNREALLKLISNEKYAGVVRLQKTVVQSGRQIKNREIASQYVYENAHPAIITAEVYAQAQIARLGRSKVMQQNTVMEISV